MRKILLILAVLVVAAVAFTGCGKGSAGNEAYKKITSEEAKELMDSEDVVVVDVRRQDEYDAGHIKGAVLVPNETISEEAPAVLEDKNAKILVYCRSGRRSKEAANKLIDLGYTDVRDFGGIIDWPYDIVTEK